MADFVRVPESDWQDILDAVREKTGGTAPMVSGAVAVEIAGISGGGSGGVNYHITKLTITEEVGKIKFSLKNYEDTELFLSITTGSGSFKFKLDFAFPSIANDKYVVYVSAAADTAQYVTLYNLRILNKSDNPNNRHIYIHRKNAILTWNGPYYANINESYFSITANTSGETFPIGTNIELIEVYK